MVGDWKMVPCSHLLLSRVLIAVLFFIATILTVAGRSLPKKAEAAQLMLYVNEAYRSEPRDVGVEFVGLLRHYHVPSTEGHITYNGIFEFDDRSRRRSGLAEVTLYVNGPQLILAPIKYMGYTSRGPNWTPINKMSDAAVLRYANEAAQRTSDNKWMHCVSATHVSCLSLSIRMILQF